jgi:hypothetical protein
MIQDAHPLRSGMPDGYVALYEIDIVVAATTWTVNQERLPSGFGGATAGSSNAFSATGVGALTFPAGMKVRGAKGNVDSDSIVAANQFHCFVTNINEAAGTCNFVITTTGAPTVLANPTLNSTVYVELDLETV